MSVTETVLIYVGCPLGLFLLFALLVFGPSAARQPRYRAGRPWTHDPVWFLPAPSGTHIPGLDDGADVPSIEPARALLDAPVRTAVGGATGEW